ncbi:adenylate kinase isoenzyme 1 isoform X4 [Alligator mississippiensis]|uniref:Adenylate kinase isoenzyme 1 n=1 Tax=Alligator mississippiensis TaxID=8496 RepID=A0A151NU74_ALLMI|nr:adenylate kinase isoenzyme 1 isoform X4 [Alligator mississippiensis]KYO40328.1 adenylate kinase isoenzyme 1 [Alligator mississippiensis]
MGLCQSRLPKTATPLKPELREKLKAPIIVFMVGGPGSGKATQCQRLAAKYGFHHLSMGRVLWDEACKLTTQGQQIRDIMLKGALVPSGFVIDLLNDNMLKNEGAKGFLIDGFPREINQAKDFEFIARRPPNMVIAFDCSTETMIQRLLLRGQTGHRADDQEAIIRQRLETYYSLCEPVVAYYHQNNLLRNIMGEESEDAIFAKCCSVIDSLL